jgi:hypothetical protein
MLCIYCASDAPVFCAKYGRRRLVRPYVTCLARATRRRFVPCTDAGAEIGEAGEPAGPPRRTSSVACRAAPDDPGVNRSDLPDPDDRQEPAFGAPMRRMDRMDPHERRAGLSWSAWAPGTDRSGPSPSSERPRPDPLEEPAPSDDRSDRRAGSCANRIRSAADRVRTDPAADQGPIRGRIDPPDGAARPAAHARHGCHVCHERRAGVSWQP